MEEIGVKEAIEYIERHFNDRFFDGNFEAHSAKRKALSALKKQLPKKPYMDNENGVYEKEHCPTCHKSLFPNDHHCKCGQTLDWGDI